MRRGALACAVLLCALPAQGELTTLPPAVVDALTQIDASPSKSTLNEMFSTPQAALDNLRAIALDHTIDPGVELRAIRALPVYCPTPPLTCGSTVVHDTLHILIDDYNTTPHTPQSQLRLRAAVEALGATRTSLASDVDKLIPLLADRSRDVRVTVALALRNVCSAAAIEPLRALFQTEPVEQVRVAISAALRDLRQCP
jgi:HEAT repeat protein